jgi:hypothetical protein
MAKVVNVNILKTKAGIEEDRKLIDETISRSMGRNENYIS